jgi:hypothetical protein
MRKALTDAAEMKYIEEKFPQFMIGIAEKTLREERFLAEV